MITPSPLLIPSLDLPWLWLGLAYLLGALPFAVWVGQKAGKDPRSTGSKNPGASNVARTAGIRWGLVTLILDALKGAIIPWLILGGYLISKPVINTDGQYLNWSFDLIEWASFAGIISVLGHITSPFLAFKGGRGVATALGAMFALHSGVALVTMFIWLIVLMLTRIPAWSSLALALAFILLSQSVVVSDAVRIFAVCTSALIVIRHWTHLEKLLRPMQQKTFATGLSSKKSKTIKNTHKKRKKSNR